MKSFRDYGIIAFIIICFISLLFVINEIVEDASVHQLETSMYEHAQAIKTLAYNSNENTFNTSKRLKAYSHSINSQMTIYSAKGDIIYSTQKKTASFSDLPHNTLQFKKKTYTYVSPLKKGKNIKAYIVFTGDKRVVQGVFLLDFVISILGLLVIFGYIQIMRRFTRPLKEATQVAESLAHGNYKTRTYENQSFDGSAGLGKSLNELARNLEVMTTSYQEQKNQLRTLIDNLGSGLIFIDDAGYINLVNKTFRQTFGLKANHWFEQPYQQEIAIKEIVELIDETIMVETTLRKQIAVDISVEHKYFDVYSAPILDSKKRIRGVVLVFHDITELKNLEQVRKDFVANVSHELKTPITSITGFAETLLDGNEVDEDLRYQFLSIIHKESLRLQELIHDLLELSKIEQNNFQLYWDFVDLRQLVQETVLILNEKAKAKDIEIDVESDQVAIVPGDSGRLQQVLINLLNNAINYTPKQGKVWIKVINGTRKVKVIVRDTGIGIDPIYHSRIFERFYRVDRARSRNSGGTGLGLAIVKHLIDAHGGTIDVKSKVGEGSTFTISLNKK